MLQRLEEAGCDRSVVGLVLPTGYSFNLDGTCIYLTMASIFIAQALGVPLSLGGPYVGLLAASKRFIRRMPGRLIGRTTDAEGRPAYCLTLQTREQHIRGARATYQGHRRAATFGVLPHTAPNGRTFLWLTHGHGNADSPHGSDSRECHDGWITVTPLVADLTAHDLILPLAEALR